MPPVINECRKYIDDDRGRPVAAMFFQMKDRRVTQPAIPRLASENRDPELDGIDQNHATPPRVDARKLHRGP